MIQLKFPSLTLKLSANSKYVDPEDEDGKITTEYAEFIKAYVVYSKKTKDEFPVIESIVVIVNDGEDAALLDIED